MPDAYFYEKLELLEELVTEHHDSPETRKAHIVLIRARQALRNDLLEDAPLLRRHILYDLHRAIQSLTPERKPHEYDTEPRRRPHHPRRA